MVRAPREIKVAREDTEKVARKAVREYLRRVARKAVREYIPRVARKAAREYLPRVARKAVREYLPRVARKALREIKDLTECPRPQNQGGKRIVMWRLITCLTALLNFKVKVFKKVDPLTLLIWLISIRESIISMTFSKVI